MVHKMSTVIFFDIIGFRVDLSYVLIIAWMDTKVKQKIQKFSSEFSCVLYKETIEIVMNLFRKHLHCCGMHGILKLIKRKASDDKWT